MKVWVVSHAYAALVNHDKLRALARLPDVELTVLTPRAWPTAFGVVRLCDAATSYRVVPARTLGGGRIGAYLYRDGIGELRRARPDVVHAEVEPWSLAALQCLLAAPRSRFVVFTWENLEGRRRLLSRAVERLVLRRAAFVIAGNRGALARILRRSVSPDRTAVLPQFGVDPDRYGRGNGERVQARFALARPVVGYIGRLVPEKGVDVLTAALEGLDARLLVVGEGPSRRDLERRLAAWPSGKAAFAGAVGHADIPDYLAFLDALVLPSRTTLVWAEQFGHVLIEAMAAGVPVVGSSSGAIPEVIGDAGLIFPEGDVEALRRRLQSLLADESLRKRLVEHGHARVRAHYSNAVIATAQREIYVRVLAR